MASRDHESSLDLPVVSSINVFASKFGRTYAIFVCTLGTRDKAAKHRSKERIARIWSSLELDLILYHCLSQTQYVGVQSTEQGLTR